MPELTLPELLTVVGLLMDFGGVGLLSRYGVSDRVDYTDEINKGRSRKIVEGPERDKRIERRGEAGMFLIMFGFALQLVATLLL